MSDAPDVLFERRGPGGRLGVITLNRPRKLNTLTHEMLVAIGRTLSDWQGSISQVLLVGAGEKGLCAGGDVTGVRASLLAGEPVTEFFADEYRVDVQLAEYAHPIVALMDGVTFGGGIGISAHHQGLRVVTERSQLAMPETAIGYLPDVGGSYWLSQLPGRLPEHAALTGLRFGPEDALAFGLADWLVPAPRLAELAERLATEPASEVVPALATLRSADAGSASGVPVAGPSPIAAAWIDKAYAAPTLAEIAANVAEAASAGEPGADVAAEALASASPLALAVTLEVVRSNRSAADLREAIAREYGAGMVLIGHDFAEGVRAKLVDKDNAPTWRPAAIDALDPQLVAAIAEGRGTAPLTFPG